MKFVRHKPQENFTSTRRIPKVTIRVIQEIEVDATMFFDSNVDFWTVWDAAGDKEEFILEQLSRDDDVGEMYYNLEGWNILGEDTEIIIGVAVEE